MTARSLPSGRNLADRMPAPERSLTMGNEHFHHVSGSLHLADS